jgi:hypothetical protein
MSHDLLSFLEVRVLSLESCPSTMAMGGCDLAATIATIASIRIGRANNTSRPPSSAIVSIPISSMSLSVSCSFQGSKLPSHPPRRHHIALDRITATIYSLIRVSTTLSPYHIIRRPQPHRAEHINTPATLPDSPAADSLPTMSFSNLSLFPPTAFHATSHFIHGRPTNIIIYNPDAFDPSQEVVCGIVKVRRLHAVDPLAGPTICLRTMVPDPAPGEQSIVVEPSKSDAFKRRLPVIAVLMGVLAVVCAACN